MASTLRLGAGAPPAAVLRGLQARARRLALPPPAALTGDWFGSAAVLAPSVAVTPCPVEVAFVPSRRVAFPAREAGAVGGGWIGYRAYPDGTGMLPAAAGGWTDCVLRLDHEGCWWYESLRGEPCPPDVVRTVGQGGPTGSWGLEWTVPDGAAHQANIRRCLAAIADGEIYQACVCTRFTGTFTGEPLELFASGIETDDPARAAYLAGAWGAVVSLSPELFLSRRGRVVRSSPIKGTLPITADPAQLRESAKDVAENVMIVDLVRNDFGRVCVPGSITVPELLAIHRAPAVWHLVSTVQGLLRPGVGNAELLAATFPPASVTGTPKLRARQLIAGWEPVERGVYCGSVGMYSPGAGLELNVAIRTVEIAAQGGAALGVGGGITADSEPGAEWQECLTKAAAVTTLRMRAPRTSS